MRICAARPVGGAASTPITVTFTHGLVGGWSWCSASDITDHAHLMFHTSANVLCFHDAQKMGGWKEGTWGSDRGPDPILEHKAFVANILDNLNRPVFDKELCEVMLEQKWFNGIGNYLRAEAMFRAAVSPFTKARQIFAKTPKNFDFSKIGPDSDKGAIILYLCKQIPLEVITQDMNKYGTPEQKSRFQAWLRIYDKGTQVRKNGRAVHYASSQVMEGVLKPDLGTPIVDMSGATAPLAPTSASAAPKSSISAPTFGTQPSQQQASPSSNSGLSTAALTQMLPLVVGHKQMPSIFAAAAQGVSAPSNHTFADSNQSFKEISSVGAASFASLPPASKLLVLLSQARRAGRLSPENHKLLKVRVIFDDVSIYSALEVYETDQDMEDFIDTVMRLCNAPITAPAAKAPVSVSASPASSFASSFTSSSSAPVVRIDATTPVASVASAVSSSSIAATLTEPTWIAALSSELQKEYFSKLDHFVQTEYRTQKKVYPPRHLIFNAFNSCPLPNVKVVILGQDPYFNPDQAHGLCFSVQKGIQPPPSLLNIFKELEQDIPGFSRPSHGCLQSWADQGVFMLNAILTVRDVPMSHAKQGWEIFTSHVIDVINQQCQNVVFLLWGLPAQSKAYRVDESKHLVLKAGHPSPLSATKGFFGCKHFSQTNAYLQQKGRTPINWQL